MTYKTEIVFLDELDEEFDDIYSEDVQAAFDNSYANKKYIVFGIAERWDRKGEAARGHYDKIFNSIIEAIQHAVDGWGVCYLKIYEKNYGRLYIDICHHDGNNTLEIRELTQKGEDFYSNNCYDCGVVKRLISSKNYTKNTKFSKNYW